MGGLAARCSRRNGRCTYNVAERGTRLLRRTVTRERPGQKSNRRPLGSLLLLPVAHGDAVRQRGHAAVAARLPTPCDIA